MALEWIYYMRLEGARLTVLRCPLLDQPDDFRLQPYHVQPSILQWLASRPWRH